MHACSPLVLASPNMLEILKEQFGSKTLAGAP